MLHNTVHCVRAVLHDDVQIGLTLFVPGSVESMLQFHNIRMAELFHNCNSLFL